MSNPATEESKDASKPVTPSRKRPQISVAPPASYDKPATVGFHDMTRPQSANLAESQESKAVKEETKDTSKPTTPVRKRLQISVAPPPNHDRPASAGLHDMTRPQE